MWRAIGQVIAAVIAAIFSSWQSDQNAKQLGAAQAENDTDQIIEGIADAQAANNADLRDLATVLNRLHNVANGASSAGADTASD